MQIRNGSCCRRDGEAFVCRLSGIHRIGDIRAIFAELESDKDSR